MDRAAFRNRRIRCALASGSTASSTLSPPDSLSHDAGNLPVTRRDQARNLAEIQTNSHPLVKPIRYLWASDLIHGYTWVSLSLRACTIPPCNCLLHTEYLLPCRMGCRACFPRRMPPKVLTKQCWALMINASQAVHDSGKSTRPSKPNFALILLLGSQDRRRGNDKHRMHEP